MRYLLIFGILLSAWSTVCWAQGSRTPAPTGSATISAYIGATDEPVIGWKPWFCPEGHEWRESESGEYAHCCPVGQENCFQGYECLSTSLIVEANGQRTHTCSGPNERPVCVTGTVYDQVGETNSVLNVACWPSWTVDWDATRTTTMAVPTPTPPTTPNGENTAPPENTGESQPQDEEGQTVDGGSGGTKPTGLTRAEKIGIGFGVPAFVLLCGVAFWWLRRSKRHNPSPTAAAAPVGPGSVMTYSTSYQDSDPAHEPSAVGHFFVAPLAVLRGHRDRRRPAKPTPSTSVESRPSDSASARSAGSARDGTLAPEVAGGLQAPARAYVAPPAAAAATTSGQPTRVIFPDDYSSAQVPPPVPVATRPTFPQDQPRPVVAATTYPGEVSPQEQHTRRFSDIHEGGMQPSFARSQEHRGSEVPDAAELSAVRPVGEMSGESPMRSELDSGPSHGNQT